MKVFRAVGFSVNHAFGDWITFYPVLHNSGDTVTEAEEWRWVASPGDLITKMSDNVDTLAFTAEKLMFVS